MNAAGSVVLDAAISALVASRRQSRYDDEESDYYYFSDTSSGRRRRGRRRPRRATVRTAAAAAESSIVAFCQTLLTLIKRIVYVSFVSTVILTLSVLTYGVLYHLSMPRLAIRLPIYFDYNFVPERHLSGAYGRYIEKQKATICNSNPNEDGCGGKEEIDQCAHSTKKDARLLVAPPTAVVDLTMQHTQWHAYHEQVLPATYENSSGAHVIKPNRRHFMDLALTLPESDLNRQLGMMMVEVDLLASDGTLMASSGRPTMLPHESALIGVARKMVLMGPILIGAVAEARTVVLESFDSYVESPELPLAAVVVRLVAPQNTGIGENHNHAPIQVHSGEVRIGKELNTIQGIMKVWFYSVGLAAVSFLSFFYAFWFLLIRAWIRRQMQHYHGGYRRRAGDERNNRGGYDFEYDADNDNESDWDDTDGDDGGGAHEGEPDKQSIESGVNFEELNESDDENWDSIHQTSQNNANEEENDGGDKSNGEVEVQNTKRNSNDEGTPDDDLESLAEELVNDLSFDISEVDSKNETEGESPAAVTNGAAPGGSGTSGKRTDVKTPSPRRKGSKPKVPGSCSRGVKNVASNSNGNLRKEAEEKLLAEKVMRGDFGPSFEVFTDLDEPEPVL